MCILERVDTNILKALENKGMPSCVNASIEYKMNSKERRC